MPRVETGADLPEPLPEAPHIHHDGNQFVKGSRKRSFKSADSEAHYRHFHQIHKDKQKKRRRANRRLTRALHALEWKRARNG